MPKPTRDPVAPPKPVVAAPVADPLPVEPVRLPADQAVRLECLKLALSLGASRHDSLMEIASELFDYVMSGKRATRQ